MVLEYTKETNTYYASAQARQFTFLHNTGADGNHYFLTREDVHPDDWEKAENVSKLIHMGRDNAQTTVRLKKTDGCYLWCNVALTVLREKDGKIVRSMITVTDVDKAIADRRELEYRAEYDELTGHYNFSKFKTDAAALLRSRREEICPVVLRPAQLQAHQRHVWLRFWRPGAAVLGEYRLQHDAGGRDFRACFRRLFRLPALLRGPAGA